MKNTDQDARRFINAVKRELDQGAEELSPEMASRLREARREALCQPSRRLPWFRPAWGLAAAAVMGMILTVVWLGQPGEPSLQVLEDAELLASSDALEFYEDLDFYYWLAEHEQTS